VTSCGGLGDDIWDQSSIREEAFLTFKKVQTSNFKVQTRNKETI
jgi:hypothetical protein